MGIEILTPPFRASMFDSGTGESSDGYTESEYQTAYELAWVDNFLPIEPAYFATTENEFSRLTYQLMAGFDKTNCHIVKS